MLSLDRLLVPPLPRLTGGDSHKKSRTATRFPSRLLPTYDRVGTSHFFFTLHDTAENSLRQKHTPSEIQMTQVGLLAASMKTRSKVYRPSRPHGFTASPHDFHEADLLGAQWE